MAVDSSQEHPRRRNRIPLDEGRHQKHVHMDPWDPLDDLSSFLEAHNVVFHHNDRNLMGVGSLEDRVAGSSLVVSVEEEDHHLRLRPLVCSSPACHSNLAQSDSQMTSAVPKAAADLQTVRHTKTEFCDFDTRIQGHWQCQWLRGWKFLGR